jgi:hypothetical protein
MRLKEQFIGLFNHIDADFVAATFFCFAGSMPRKEFLCISI